MAGASWSLGMKPPSRRELRVSRHEAAERGIGIDQCLRDELVSTGNHRASAVENCFT